MSFAAVFNDPFILALGACNDTFNSSDHISSDDRIISEQWNGKGVEAHSQDLLWGTMLVVAWRDWGKPPLGKM